MPSTIDLIAPFDPTAYVNITGAQLLQLVSGAFPYTDKGLTIVTTDTGDVPDVPDADTNTKWQQYLWVRRGTTNVAAYVWNPAAAVNATYRQWVSINIAAIGIGTVQGYMIADNTITDAKIISLDWSKITGTPTGIAPTGAAGGDLTGTYPNPSVATDAITTSKILDLNVTGGKLEAGSTTTGVAPTKMQSSGVAGAVMQDTGTTGAWTVPNVIYNLANPAGVGDAGKIPRVNGAGTAFELSPAAASVVSIFRGGPTAVATGGFIAATAHGLGGVPDAIHGYLVCTSADGNYAVGDIIPISAAFGSNPSVDGSNVLAPGADATNVWCTYAPAGNTSIYIPTKTTNSVTDIVTTILTKWSVKLVAIKYS